MSRRISFGYQAAIEAGEMRHAAVVMRELAAVHGFAIAKSEPFPIGDCFHFWLEGADGVEFPPYIYEVSE